MSLLDSKAASRRVRLLHIQLFFVLQGSNVGMQKKPHKKTKKAEQHMWVQRAQLKAGA